MDEYATLHLQSPTAQHHNQQANPADNGAGLCVRLNATDVDELSSPPILPAYDMCLHGRIHESDNRDHRRT